MTRRNFMWTAAMAPAAASAAPAPLAVPVHRVIDSRAKFTPQQLRRFSIHIWQEAVRDFRRCGIEFQVSEVAGEIKRSPGDRPILVGLERGALNLVLTDHIPLKWDTGRGLAGVTVLYQGYHLCMVALGFAHGHQIPYVSTNTCVHEMLHAFMLDIFVSRPKWYQVAGRESRIDWYATGLWLFHDCAAVRQSTEAYLRRLQSGSAALKEHVVALGVVQHGPA